MNRDCHHNKLVSFLTNDLAISDDAIAVAIKQCNYDTDPLPMVLWQYGLLSLDQLNHTFDWLSNQTHLIH